MKFVFHIILNKILISIMDVMIWLRIYPWEQKKRKKVMTSRPPRVASNKAHRDKQGINPYWDKFLFPGNESIKPIMKFKFHHEL
ncbi:hypothetical protein D0C27_03875 [Alcaligenes faecalis]|nr:hypothetical protein D0C27_03875 [Alcaligenes faecalis]